MRRTQENTVTTLSFLVEHNYEAIVKAGDIVPLISLLNNESEKAKEYALKTPSRPPRPGTPCLVTPSSKAAFTYRPPRSYPYGRRP